MYIFRYLLSLLLDYFRWTQTVPMVLAWAFILIMLLAMTIVNFQSASMNAIIWITEIWTSIEWLPSINLDESSVAQEDGSLHISNEQLKPLILKAWGILAMVLFVLDLIRTAFFEPGEPPTLKRKLTITAIACALLTIGFGLNYVLGNSEYKGNTAGWAFLFIAFPLGVWMISAYSLCVGHYIRWINNKLTNAEPGQRRY